MSKYALFPELTEQGKQEAQKIMDSFKERFQKLADSANERRYAKEVVEP